MITLKGFSPRLVPTQDFKYYPTMIEDPHGDWVERSEARELARLVESREQDILRLRKEAEERAAILRETEEKLKACRERDAKPFGFWVDPDVFGNAPVTAATKLHKAKSDLVTVRADLHASIQREQRLENRLREMSEEKRKLIDQAQAMWERADKAEGELRRLSDEYSGARDVYNDRTMLLKRISAEKDAMRKERDTERQGWNECVERYQTAEKQWIADAETWAQTVKTEVERANKLQAFKTFVHEFLDKEHVPADPEPEETKRHGCRISERLKWVLLRANYGVSLPDRAGYNQQLKECQRLIKQNWDKLQIAEARIQAAMRSLRGDAIPSVIGPIEPTNPNTQGA